VPSSPPSPARTAPARTLDSLANGASARVVEVRLDPADAAWLSAVGIGVGDTLTVLRRALFGGPLHIATESGGEFALGAPLAQGIVIADAP
jgi:ferrous iron transport protein A